jgi:hypothetical protein
MGNNNLTSTNNILVKVDQNNLIYIDPNSVLVNGVVQPRAVEPENLVMYVNLEADLVPRTTLIADGNKSTLTSIAQGTLNLLQNKKGTDLDTSWTDAYTQSPIKFISTPITGQIPIVDVTTQTDQTAQSFGIESIKIEIAGANFIPRVVIKFVDVRGKTLFESPPNSPYAAFFHLPWPIFYLTVKGYYGKAIKYRLHLIKFNSRYNSMNGNFEIETNFVGSTYAYLADISLDTILNAPYFYISESDYTSQTNTQTGVTTRTVNKSTKGYRTLRSVYQEYISLGLLPKDFPVKTLREIIIIAGRLNKMLEKEIFANVISPKLLAGVKDFEDNITAFENAVVAWKSRYLTNEFYTTNEQETVNGTTANIQWFKLAGTDKNTLANIVGPTTTGTLEHLIKTYVDLLDNNQTFGDKRDVKTLTIDKIKINSISLSLLKNIKNFYRQVNAVGVNINGILDDIYAVEKDFVEQRNKLEDDIERQMNIIVSRKDIGIGFEPTIRNIIGVILANAETYVRLMKDVHDKAFQSAQKRKKILQQVLTDSINSAEAIYPWPEIKAQTAGNKNLVLMYPGSREMAGKLQADDKTLWPEVDFVENFYEVSTKKADNLTGTKEGSPENIEYIFNTKIDTNRKDISTFTNVLNYIPYSDKSFSSILYEIFERAKYTTALSPFSVKAIQQLADVEFFNLQTQILDDIDIVDMLKSNIKDTASLYTQMLGLSPYERFPYFQDQLPTIPYVKSTIEQDFSIQKYVKNTTTTNNYNSDYSEVTNFLWGYRPESYRKTIYPFNSSTYLPYLGQKAPFAEKNLYLNQILSVDTPNNNFIASPIEPTMWVKDGFTDNLFTNTIKINDIDKHILNTPYFHKQLFSDFAKTQSQGKYVGSSYLLLNSLPFKDLDDEINAVQLQALTNGLFGAGNTLVSTVFREIGASHHIPYHMMLKWGSIYHRYKKNITEGIDIINGVTVPIDGNLFFDNSQGRIYTAYTDPSESVTVDRNNYQDVGIHPFYDDIFHQIVNGYPFFDYSLGPLGYNVMLTSGVTKSFYGIPVGLNTWSTCVDNSKFDNTDTRYTLLPCSGIGLTNGDDFDKAEQENFRLIWNIGTIDKNIIDYTSRTFPSPYEYFKSTGSTYSLDMNYKKAIDLIATFKSDILDVFEQAFLDFASEKLKEEIPYKPYKVAYSNFQDLLLKIVSVTKSSNDPTSVQSLLNTVKISQMINLSYLTNEILSTDNLINITLSNPREIDTYVLGGFTGTNVKNFSVNAFDASQLTPENLNYIKLYLGEDIDGYYADFFSVNDIELNEMNIQQFRSLIYMFAGLSANGTPKTKSGFIDHLKTNIISPIATDVRSVSGMDARLLNFLERLITKIQSSAFTVPDKNQTATIHRGYNDENPLKLESYNYFKSFNDKWTSGNSIGQRTLMEEFLFLDKANKDIGDSVYLDMEKLTTIANPGNEKLNLFSLISLLIQDSGFDIRVLPAYVNFYGTNFSNTTKITPSKNVAENMFGAFLNVDYQDSMPKVILQYMGPTSKHLELSDIDKKYMYKNDGFNIGDVNNNPVMVAPDIFTKTDFSKSNKVVAFEVSFGDQNQSIFKAVDLDQSTIKNTSESFIVLERLGQSETGSSTAQVDVGLFDIYRQSSYQCTVTSMGNAMIQPTMYFYLKNIPMFKGSYWITEVTHNIKTTGIETIFKGTRIPNQSLPNPKDSFLASYRSLFDKMIKQAVVQVKGELTGNTGDKQTIVTASGAYTYDTDNTNIPGENIIQDAGLTKYAIPYNGYDEDPSIQMVNYQGSEWLRARVVQMGGKLYNPDDSTVMNIISRLTAAGGFAQAKTVKWGDIKGTNSICDFYVCKFNINPFRGIKPDDLMKNFTTTEFLNPNMPRYNKKAVSTPGNEILASQLSADVIVKTGLDFINNIYTGPISVGPLVTIDLSNYIDYGIGLSKSLMDKLKLVDGGVVYFRLS